jgi:hypothetical protein
MSGVLENPNVFTPSAKVEFDKSPNKLNGEFSLEGGREATWVKGGGIELEKYE